MLFLLIQGRGWGELNGMFTDAEIKFWSVEGSVDCGFHGGPRASRPAPSRAKPSEATATPPAGATSSTGETAPSLGKGPSQAPQIPPMDPLNPMDPPRR